MHFLFVRLFALPLKVILPVIALCAFGIALIVWATPACSSINIFGIVVDKSRGCPTSAEAKSPKASPPSKTTDPDNADAAIAEDQSMPTRTGPDRIEVMSAPATARDIETGNHLSLVDAETDTLANTPNSTFGFFFGGSLASVWRHDIGSLSIRNDVRDIYFEGQKRSDGAFYIIGYVRRDVAQSLAQHEAPPRFKLQSQRYRPHDAVVAIPFGVLRIFGESLITFEKGRFIPILEVGLKST